MSDFFSDAWSIFIAATTVVSLIACLALLAFASRRTQMANDNSNAGIDIQRLRWAIARPLVSQNVRSSGRQSVRTAPDKAPTCSGL